MDLVDKRLIAEFVVESHEGLAHIEQQMLAIEAGGANVDIDLVNAAFRTVHSIKGVAGFLGLGRIGALAHGLEEVLDRMRDRDVVPNSELVTTVLHAADHMKQLIDAAEWSNHADVSEHVEALARFRPDTDLPLQAAELAQKVTSLPSPSTAATKDSSTPVAGDSTIRVDVALIDKLMTRVGELVLARDQILQYASHLEDSHLVSMAQRLNLITAELQESVMKMRMQPIGDVWAKFPRVVRDLSSQLGKRVRIEMEGKETELDKSIVEAIKDPLTHLVRNSVDHGIESPEARRAAGKPPEGRLLLRACHEGGQVNIEITDDGAGLNLDRIRHKAVERGLFSADQAARMSQRDLAQLTFAPGFSTAEKVTSVSGRGVGLDVVRTNIERISGTIDLQSQEGQGTSVRIKIPLTLAVIPALVVTHCGDR